MAAFSDGHRPRLGARDAFYAAMAKYDPLITHGGERRRWKVRSSRQRQRAETAPAAGAQVARDRGALCEFGADTDLDKGVNGPQVGCFALFERLMAAREFEGRLFGEISALPQKNRMEVLPRVLAHNSGKAACSMVSDYPLPGCFRCLRSMNLFHAGGLVPR